LSRIGKRPIPIPQGVDVQLDAGTIRVKGPKGALSRKIPEGIAVEVRDGSITCRPASDDKNTVARWGLCRVLVGNMVTGVNVGYRKDLEIVGVGYRTELKGRALSLSVGYSHPVLIEPPQGIQFTLGAPNRVTVEGPDKEVVGQIAAQIRDARPPEPYKGKGIRYLGEQITRKAGKAAGK
jgi:large subunit ribosomal protein L6